MSSPQWLVRFHLILKMYKKIVVGFALLVCITVAQAQVRFVPSPWRGTTNLFQTINEGEAVSTNTGYIPADYTSTYADTNTLYTNFAMQPSLLSKSTAGCLFKGVAASTDAALITISLEKSYDGTNDWQPLLTFQLDATAAAEGDTLAVGTNFTVGDFPYVRVSEITNESAVTLSRMNLFYIVK